MEEAYKFLLTEIKKNNKPIVAGISGGPDSMALLHLLLKLRDETGVKIICAHVNHNVREVSEQEAIDLERFCNEHNVIFELMKINEYGTDNFENYARIKRYSFFEELITKYNAQYLTTAHHGDDLIETIIMRIVRGSTFKGYAGFKKVIDRKKYKILRPLITITKEELINYCNVHNLKFAEDITNLDDVHTRNRYRKYMLPFLKKENANVHLKFLKFSETILEYNEYMELEVKKIINYIYNEETLDIKKFLKLNIVMQKRVINYIIGTIYIDDLMLINDMHTSSIINLINSSKPNAYIYLPNNIKVTKSYNLLSFITDNNPHNSYHLEFSSILKLPNGNILEEVEDSVDKSNFICRLNSADIELPLYVRNKKAGDRMEIKGMTGHKKIKDIFINEKISSKERDNWPILVDSNDEILWLPGLKKSKYDKSKKESYDIIIRYN
ncbi:MAG: tRNA lysidine(34) synthetase TilS [Bacilli bacterium]|nr:tRNA lysidine(34) synthetase TilS [Bacilli bacterium]MDD3305168.1 tRNA lysidine(34) synthetase TilS [Bacilli bacterium]MDD4053993.1 tRNA lysidine(34) synthetase TilS [Bacilli bacterium]MDD4411726.1 tRNA lysidine(34) synthetase TilS [Bacilli bacterium]